MHTIAEGRFAGTRRAESELCEGHWPKKRDCLTGRREEQNYNRRVREREKGGVVDGVQQGWRAAGAGLARRKIVDRAAQSSTCNRKQELEKLRQRKEYRMSNSPYFAHSPFV